MRNRNAPEIIVVDPRRTETAMAATLHLPVRPKTDLVLLYGLANLLIEQRLDRPRLHRRAHERLRRLRRVRPPVRPGARGRRDRPERRRDSRRGRADPRAVRASRSGGRWASTRATRG